jgi:hypothetical protein
VKPDSYNEQWLVIPLKEWTNLQVLATIGWTLAFFLACTVAYLLLQKYGWIKP